MVNITVTSRLLNVSLMTDAPPDPTMWLDYLTSAIVFWSMFFLVCCLILAVVRHRLPSMYTVCPWSIVFMATGGSVHIAAEYISIGHMNRYSTMEILRNFHCTFWDIWMKYDLGFLPWFWGLSGCIIYWGIVLNTRIKNVAEDDSTSRVFGVVGAPITARTFPQKVRDALVNWIKEPRARVVFYAIFVSLPLLSISVAAELANASTFNKAIGWCEAHRWFVAALVGCMVFYIAILVVLLVHTKKQKAHEIVKYAPIMDSTILGIVFLCLLVASNRFGFAVAWWGRTATTLLVCALYVLTMLRMMWQTIVSVLRYGLLKDAPNAANRLIDQLFAFQSDSQIEDQFASMVSISDVFDRFMAFLNASTICYIAPKDFTDAIPDHELNIFYSARFVARSVYAPSITEVSSTKQFTIDEDDIVVEDNSYEMHPQNPSSLPDGRIIFANDIGYLFREINIMESTNHEDGIKLLQKILVKHFPVAEKFCGDLLQINSPDGDATVLQFNKTNDPSKQKRADKQIFDEEHLEKHTLPISIELLSELYYCAAENGSNHPARCMAKVKLMCAFVLKHVCMTPYFNEPENLQHYETAKSEMRKRLAHVTNLQVV